MANKTTVALTENQFRELIKTMYEGGAGFRPNPKIATILTLEANLGLRISDILNLKMKDIIRDGGRYRLNIIEEKTGKKRTFTVPYQIKQYLDDYCELNDIPEDKKIFPVTSELPIPVGLRTGNLAPLTPILIIPLPNILLSSTTVSSKTTPSSKKNFRPKAIHSKAVRTPKYWCN